MAWRTDQIDPFATFRVAEQNDCFGAISGNSWVHFDSRSRARPSALGLGPTLSESEARVTSKDLLSSASETPAPRGVASLVRAEWFFLVSSASVAAFALFEDRLFSRLDNPLILTAILFWLFGVVLWTSLSVVRHAESLARRFGEPYGTLLLTLTITSIEVVAISAVVRHGGSNPTLMRDTLLAVIMIIMNGMVGVTLLIGGLKHREQTFNLQGANAFLSVLLPLATFALIMPDFTQTTPGPIYSVAQQVVLVIVSLALYLLFLVLQTGRYHGYFEDAGHTAAEAQGVDAPVWFSTVMLAACMAAVVYLVEQFGPPIDYLLETLQAPAPLGGIFIALLVATPESIGAVKAALDNQMQRAVNISLGSVLATIGLTIPAVLVINHLIERPTILGLEHTDLPLLILTLALSMITFTSGRTNMLQGVVHLLLFAAYILLIFQA
jgi:Ca2+:H+ antiporter